MYFNKATYIFYFDVLLNVHLSIILVINQVGFNY